jgi:PleD family two-component response regulator
MGVDRYPIINPRRLRDAIIDLRVNDDCMTGISVLVVDDHVLFADALRARLSREGDLQPIAVAYNAPDAARQAAALRPEVVILDVVLNNRSGLDLVEEIRRVFMTWATVTDAGHTSALVRAIVVAGAGAGRHFRFSCCGVPQTEQGCW